ncbi:hypothetical protein ACWD7C_12555 [Streptomyces sp. NPDC005134]|uniref:hypothetical protein n=1 Tax=Streptomyces sp. NPDC005098 TaxID=3154560 RepID=UPI0033AC8CE0
MPSHRITITSFTFLSIIFAVAMSGCSTGTQNEKSPRKEMASKPDKRESVRIANRVELPVPIEQYLLSNRQWNVLMEAEQALRNRCAQRFDLIYPDIPEGATNNQTLTEYRYGILDKKYAAKYGYRTPSARQAAGIDANLRRQKKAYSSLSKGARLVLFGANRADAQPGSEKADKGQRYKGQLIPQGGCSGEAKRKLNGSASEGDSPIAVAINMESYAKSMKDAKVRSSFSKWSSCMNSHGYKYEVPRDADNDPRWIGNPVTATEKKTAIIDTECKLKHNVAGVWYESDVAYQKEMIKENSRNLAIVKRSIENRILRAKRVLTK